MRFADIGFAPRPVRQPHPPIWIGGHTAPAIRRAARLGDGWHPIGLRPPAGLTPDEMWVAVAQLRDEASKVGRTPQQITISLRAPMAFTDGGGAQRQPLTGSVAAIQDDIGRYADCGVSHRPWVFRVFGDASFAGLLRPDLGVTLRNNGSPCTVIHDSPAIV